MLFNEIVSIIARFAAGEARSGNLRILNEKNLELPRMLRNHSRTSNQKYGRDHIKSSGAAIASA